ncbi:sodium-independent anion transporter [Paraburkholderia strydomiana]
MLTPVADEPWADELTIPAGLRDRLLIKHVDGPIFFGFASKFLDIARQATLLSRLLVLRMDRISYMDQTGVYALDDALVRLNAAGVRVLVVGVSVSQRDLLEAAAGNPGGRTRARHLQQLRRIEEGASSDHRRPSREMNTTLRQMGAAIALGLLPHATVSSRPNSSATRRFPSSASRSGKLESFGR